MKIDCKFKSIDHSQSLVSYIEEKMEKLDKYEMKPEKVQVTFRTSGHKKVAECCIQHSHEFLRAKATSDDFYEAVDKMVQKLKTQMAKRKKKVQNHKRFGHSKEGKLLQLSPELEMNHHEYRRKAG
tara:strand:- start:25287 stop:25664 length:378 start_codon:yes stop_codon:yes gene_type:complete